jgi:tetratricopeptide (TPR) repeat protein
LNPQNVLHWLSYIDALICTEKHDVALNVIAEARTHGIQSEELDVLTQRAGTSVQNSIQALTNLVAKGEHSSTEISARMFIAKYPLHIFGWRVLGIVMYQRGEFEQALDINKQIVENFPNDAGARSNLGITLLALKQYKLAEESLQRSIEINPSYADTYWNLEELYREQGLLDEAKRAKQKAVMLKLP